MSDEFTRFLGRTVPQTEQADPRQVKNSAGGYTFQVTPEDQLERFLILGTESGTYYVEEQDLTKQNLANVKFMAENKPAYSIELTADISANGRAYKNKAAIFNLAYIMTFGSDTAKSYARGWVNEIVRTFTHMATFEKYLRLLAPGSGLGTSRNRALAHWYEDKTTDDIAYQAVKYRNRDGLNHARVLRQSRPKGVDANLANWILGKEVDKTTLPRIVQGFESAQAANGIDELISVLTEYKNLPWEAVPTKFHKDVKLWKTLFYNGSLNGQALIRNITKIARLGGFDDLVFARDFATKLSDKEQVRRTKLHPINFLNALTIYTDGQVQRSSDIDQIWARAVRRKDWTNSPIITDALNEGYHASFGNVEPSNKRTLIGVDVSGSMSSSMSLGLDLTAAQVAGAMATAIAKTEPYYQIMGFAHQFRDLGITANMDLNTVMRKVQDSNFGRTDCALSMTWALQNKLEFDTFIVITDNETYAGSKHPHVALKEYRQKTGIDARMIVVATTSTGFTIANPSDRGMMDVVGADSNLPKLISEFSKGNL